MQARQQLLVDLANQIRMLIDHNVELDDAKMFFHTALDCLVATLKTNAYRTDRLCLALRLHPGVLCCKDFFSKRGPEAVELPYGVFFAIGRDFIAFHVRFRDIARGGLQLLLPNSADQFTVGMFTLDYS